MSKLAAKGDLKGLIKALGYQRDWLVRRQAVEALKAIGDTRAIEALVGALGDNNSTVRDEAAEALQTLGVSSVEPLVETPSDGVSGAHDSEAEDVGQLGDAGTVEASPAAPVEPAAPRMAAGRARTFRLFVSSTFNDFELEREPPGATSSCQAAVQRRRDPRSPKGPRAVVCFGRSSAWSTNRLIRRRARGR